MATSSEPVHGHEYVDFDEYIDIQLRKTRSTIKTTDVLTAAVGILTLLTLYLLLFVICDHWIVRGGFGPVSRGIMLTVVVTAICGWGIVKIVVPWRRRVSGLYAASTIEKASPALKSSLLNLVDIARSGHEVSPEIYHSIERRAALALTHVDVNETVDRRTLLRLSNALLAVVVLFCLYWIFSPKNPATSLWRAIVPMADLGVATRTEIFNVRPGDKDVLARSQLEVTADIRGEIPAQTFLHVTTADRKYVDERIEMRLENEATRKFRCVLTGDNGGGILQNMTYRVVAGDASTREYRIRVIQPPAATIDSIRLESPAYTRREPMVQTTGGIDALEGTHVTLKAHANMPVRSPAMLQFFDDESATKRMDEIPIRVTDGTKLEVDWKLEIRDGVYPHYYRIFCTNLEGEADPSPNLYSLMIRPDQAPEILLRDPKTDLELPANAILPLVIEARDPDFGLSYIDLNIEKDGSPVNGPTIYSERNDQQFKTTYKWSLRDYHFRPRETVTYWLEAKDNRQPIANVSKTPRLRIRIIDVVSEEQVKKDLAMNQQRQKEEIDKSDAQHAAQEKPDTDNPSPNPNQKPQKAGRPQDQLASRDQRQNPSQQGEGGERSDTQNGEGQNGNQQNARQNEADKGEGGHKDQDSAGDDDKKQKLNPNDPADDSKALQRLLDKERRDQEKKDNSSGGGQENEGADQPKKSQKNSSSDPNQKSDAGSPSKSPQNGKTGDQKSDQGNQSSKSNSSASKPSGADQSGAKPAGSKPQNGQTDQKKQEGGDQSQPKNGERDQAGGAGEKKDQANGAKPTGEKPSELTKGGDKPDTKSTQQNGSQRGETNGSKKDAADGSPQSKQDSQKPGDRREEKPRGDQQPGSSNQDQSQGGKSQQPENGSNQQSPSNSSSQPSPESKQSQNKQGNTADNAKDKPGAADQSKKNDGSSQNGDDARNEKGTKQETNGPPQGRSQTNTGDSANNQNTQNRDDAGQKKDANGNKEPGANEKGGKQFAQDNRNQKDSAKREKSENASQKANADQRGDKAQTSPRDKQEQPDKATTDNASRDDNRQKKGQKTEAAGGDNSDEQNQKSKDHRPKKSAEDEPPVNNPQADEGQPKSTQNKKPRPVGGGDSETGSAADSQQGGNQQGATAKQGSAGKSSKQESGGQSQEESGGQNKPGSKKENGDQQREEGSRDQKQNSNKAKTDEQNHDQKASQKPNGGSEGKQQEQGQQGQDQKGQNQQGQGQQGQGKQGQGQQGQGQQGKGQQGKQGQGQSGAGKDGKNGASNQAGSNGSKSGAGTGQSTRGNQGGGFNDGSGGGEGAPLEDTTKQANLDYAKKATDLVLQRLESQLKRGQVDKKVEEELGWTKDQVRQFVERMRRQSQAAEDPTSPAAEARRLQFEETLKSLNLHSPVKARSSRAVPKTNDNEIESKRSIPPPEYRDLYNAFTKSLAKQAPSSTDDKK
jgi:collagen type III alpha